MSHTRDQFFLVFWDCCCLSPTTITWFHTKVELKVNFQTRLISVFSQRSAAPPLEFVWVGECLHYVSAPAHWLGSGSDPSVLISLDATRPSVLSMFQFQNSTFEVSIDYTHHASTSNKLSEISSVLSWKTTTETEDTIEMEKLLTAVYIVESGGGINVKLRVQAGAESCRWAVGRDLQRKSEPELRQQETHYPVSSASEVAELSDSVQQEKKHQWEKNTFNRNFQPKPAIHTH